MAKRRSTSSTTETIEGAEIFDHHEVAQLEAMSLADIEQIWDLVSTEDRDYLTRRYRKSIRTHGISSDEQEISMAYQYLQRYAYEGLVPAGDQWVRISASRRQQLKTRQTDTAEIDDDEGVGIPWMTVAVAGFGIFLLIFVLSRVLGGDDEEVTIADTVLTSTPTVTFTPSPTATITSMPTATPIALVESDSFIQAGDGRNHAWFPVQLQVLGADETQPRVFIVQEREIALTEWTFDPNLDVASWISGIHVHSVFGISHSESNAEWMTSLSNGAQFVIRMNTGSELVYTYAETQALGRENTTLLRQDQPGIVLVLIGETGSDGLPTSRRTFVTGTYNPGIEVDLSSAAALPIPIGQTVQLSDLSLRVDDAYVVPVPDSTLDAFMYAVVDVTLTAGETDVSLTGYQWFLDADNARYSPDLSLTSGTSHDPLPAILPVGQAVNASLAFLVNRFDGTALLLFSPHGVAGETFSVAFEQPPLAVTVDLLNVQLRRIRRTSNQVFVDVRIYNPQAEAVTLALTDIGMIFGFTPFPAGATACPVDFEPIIFEPELSLDITLTWDWNSDDPFARLELAGRVWSITLIED
ncbi:MAG: hypothetical protein AAF846_25985 [Chloroflexota bacterium]